MVGSATIGALNVKLGLDTAQFDAGIKKTQASLKGISFASLAGAATGAAAVAGLTTAFVALRNAMAFGDDIADTAKRLAVTTDALQEYRFAIHALGGDFADADKALEGFSKAFGAAHAGLTKKAAKPFEALGLDPKQFASTEEALQAVIEKIANLKSTAEQAAIADKLGIGAMLPAIRDGGAAIDDLRKKAHDLGFVMSADVADRLGEANDKFEDMEQIVKAQLATAMVNLAPVLLTVSENIAKGAIAANEFIETIGSLVDSINGSAFGKALQRLGQLGAKSGGWSPTDLLPGGETARRALSGAMAKNAARVSVADIQATLGKKPAPKTGELISPAGSGGGGGKGPSDHSADAIAAAARDELRARQDLTDNIETLTKLRLQEIDAELAAQNRQAKEDAAEGSISKSAAEAVIASNERTAALKRQAVEQDATAQLAREEFDHRSALNRLLDQTADIQGEFAATASERNKIEELTLAAAQKQQRDELNEAQRLERERDGGSESTRETAKAALAALQAEQRKALASESLARTVEEQDARAQATLDIQVDILAGQSDLALSSYQRAQIELKILKLQQDEERRRLEIVANSTDLSKYQKVEVDAAKARLAELPEIHANQIELVTAGNTLLDAFADLTDAVDGMVGAFARGDIGGGISGLGNSLKSLGGLFKQGSGLSKALGSLGKTLGTVGEVASAVIGIVKSVKSLVTKPSNKGAGFDLNTGALSGKSRSAETEAAASSVGEEILKAQAALKKLGATLTSTVNGLVIGTRDLTQIYLSDGRTLTSAIGDTGAATETALKAVLEAAQFADAAQAELVKSMLASGEAASAVIDALAAAADDAKAKAEDIANKRRSLEIDLMEAQGDAQGALNARRQDELKALAALEPALAKLQSAIYDAQDLATLGNAVSEARDREAAAMQQTIDKFQAFADRLRDFQDALKADALANAAPQTQRASLLRELQNVGSLAAQGDEGAQGRFQAVAEAFLGVSKDSAKTELEIKRDQALVRNLTADALDAALEQVDVTKVQLDAMNKQVDLLLGIKTGVLTLNETILAFLAKKSAIATSAMAGGSAGGFDAAAYGAQNADVVAAFSAYASGSSPFQGNYSSGLDLNGFLAEHYKNTGLGEIAAGKRLPGFANQGTIRVGGTGGIDSQLVSLWASPNENISVTNGDPMDALDATTQVQLGQTQLLRRAVRVLERLEVDGLYSRGADPDSPVLTEAA